MRVTHQLKQSETKVCEYCKKEISVTGMGGHLSKYHGITKNGFLCVRCNNKIIKTKVLSRQNARHAKYKTCLQREKSCCPFI